jgi:hypothetical protein
VLGHNFPETAEGAVEAAVCVIARETKFVGRTFAGAGDDKSPIRLQDGRSSRRATRKRSDYLPASAKGLIEGAIRIIADKRKVIVVSVGTYAGEFDNDDLPIGLQENVIALRGWVTKGGFDTAVVTKGLIERP